MPGRRPNPFSPAEIAKGRQVQAVHLANPQPRVEFATSATSIESATNGTGHVLPGGLMLGSQKPCFLCEPTPDWVYLESESFFCMVGLGPIGEGYSLLVVRDHAICSMLDVPQALWGEYLDLRARQRQAIMAAYGRGPVYCEHGRVAVCDDRDQHEPDAHCYHAHQLVFALDVDVSSHFSLPIWQTHEFATLSEALAGPPITGEYLLFERTDGHVWISQTQHRLPRQYLRGLIAESVGQLSRANWRSFPETATIAAHATKLREIAER